MTAAPFFRYFGSKWNLSRHYPPPARDTIVEPFAGSACYATRYHDRSVLLVEKDHKIASVWRFLIGASRKDVLTLPVLEKGEKLSDYKQLSDVERWFLGLWINLSAGPRNVAQGGLTTDYLKRTSDNLFMIRHWQVIEGDYSVADNRLATWFIDPPYQSAKDKYTEGEIDYSHLAEWSRSRNGQVIVCEKHGANWLPFEPFREHTSQTSARTSGRKKYFEAIWHKEE